IHRDCRIRWGCFLRPQNLTRELMELMARAGLTHIEFGSDSFSDEVLGEYEKDLTFDDIRVSNDLAHAAEIDLCHFIIAGGPGETPRTLKQGFENSLLLGRPVVMAVPGMRIYPATPLFGRALHEGPSETDILSVAQLHIGRASGPFETVCARVTELDCGRCRP